MKVVVHVHEKTFIIPCGDGNQTCKWLAQVAAQRYTLAHQHDGRPRHHDGANRRPGAFIPSNITKDGHDFLFPTAKIKDNIKDGGEVTVTLVRQRTLDERNAPDTSIWAALAFSHSEATQEKRRQAREALQQRLADVRAQMIAKAREREQLQQQHEAAMELINLGTLESPEQVEAAVNHDWRRLEPYTLSLGKSEAVRLKAAVEEHFTLLDQAHKRYASFGQAGHYTDMALMDFAHFLHDCQVLSLEDDMEQIQLLFLTALLTAPNDATAAKSLVDEGGDATAHPSTQRDLQRQRDARQRQSREAVSSLSLLSPQFQAVLVGERMTRAQLIKAVVLLSVMVVTKQKLPGVFDEPVKATYFSSTMSTAIVPRLRKLAITPLRLELQRSDVQQVFRNGSTPLRGVFQAFSVADSDRSDVRSVGTLTLVEFVMLLRECKILGRAEAGEEDAMKLARKWFNGALQESKFGRPGQLIYAEFLEALARAAQAVWPEDALSMRDRAARAVDTVARVYRPGGSHVPPRAGGEWEALRLPPD